MRHLRTLTHTFETDPQRPCLIDARSGEHLAYGQVYDLARRAGAELRRRGLGRGDRLCVGAPNSVDLALLYLGALFAGVVIVPLGSGFGRRELRSILRRTRPELVIATGGPAERVAAVAGEMDLPLDELDPRAAAEPGDGWEPFDGVASSDLVSVHFTSGTTGPPRGVGHRLADFTGNALRYCRATGLDSSHRLYHTLPMTYMAGYYNLLLLPIAVGASVVVDQAFDARLLMRYWKAPKEHAADTLWLVPTMMAMLLEVDRGDEGAELCRERVRFAACGTAPLAAELRERFEARYGVAVHDSYGLSETLLATASTPARPAPGGTVGAPLPGVDVRIGDGGAVQIASPDMFAGYLAAEEGEEPGDGLSFHAPLIDGRWLDTGDVGEMTADGALRITGRSKEVIIRGGVNVSPVEVERALEGHPAVESLAVVGLPHAILGEEIAAVVMCRDGADLGQVEQELRATAREQLEDAQQPGTYVQIDQIPTTPTGKIRRGALRDLVIDRLGLPQPSKGFAVDVPETGAPAAAGAGAAGGPPAGRLVDLSHELREGMTTFASPNHPRVEITQLGRHHLEGRATRRLVLGTHTGTHVDAPLHFIPDGDHVGGLPLDTFVGPAVVADLTPVEPLEEIGLDRLRHALGGAPRQPRVLLRLDWSKRFDHASFYAGSPYLSEEACAWLVDQGVRLLGMDTPSPDDPRNGFGSERDSPNHLTLLGSGVVLLEYLANLDALRSEEVFLVALPLRIPGADGAPVRAVAIDPAA